MSLLSAVADWFREPTALYDLKPHRSYSDNRDGTSVASLSGERLRKYARHLEQNHDIAKGALDRLTQFIVGPAGIGIEPVPKSTDGEIHAEFQAQLLEAWRDWCHWPEVTWELDWIAVQRLMCRSWLRDGECLAQLIIGTNQTLDHGTLVPFSLELLEADLLPFSHNDTTLNIINGVERNAWNRPRAYWIYRQHPGGAMPTDLQLKRVASNNILHLKITDRIGQVRGVSVFASVLQRLNDLYEYETAERIAARIAASITGVVKTENPEVYSQKLDADGNPIARDLHITPGMILDNLNPNESIELFDSKRPSAALEPFRNGQLRAAAAGLGTSYSSLARDYNGSYSAQRQELVEGAGHYQAMSRLLREGDHEQIAAAIRVVGPKPVSDGAATDDAGNHFFTNLNENGIDRLSPQGELTPLVRDPRLQWPDNAQFGPDAWLYIAANQLHLSPAFTGGEDLGRPPYRILRVWTGTPGNRRGEK